MDLDSHALNLGKVVGNLLSLELALRAAIATLDPNTTFAWPLDDLRVGDVVRADAVTNFDSLGPTIERFNDLAPPADRLDRVRLVSLRDTLAHGRVSSRFATLPLRVVKFGREKDGMVTVEAVIEMTEAWFQEQRAMTFDAIQRVARVRGTQSIAEQESTGDGPVNQPGTQRPTSQA